MMLFIAMSGSSFARNMGCPLDKPRGVGPKKAYHRSKKPSACFKGGACSSRTRSGRGPASGLVACEERLEFRGDRQREFRVLVASPDDLQPEGGRAVRVGASREW